MSTKELAERLRKPMLTPPIFLCREAADELDRLSAENQRLREALRGMLEQECDCIYSSETCETPCPCKTARAALEEKP